MSRTSRTIIAVSLVLAGVASSAFALPPGAIDVTCDVDLKQFRDAAKPLPPGSPATFHIYSTPTGGTEINPPGYDVPLAVLMVFKSTTEKFDSVPKRKAGRINARIGSDATPVLVPADGNAFMEMTVGSTTLGCDFASTGFAPARRRLIGVPYARQADSTRDISARAFNSANISVAHNAAPTLTFDSERWDTDAIHGDVPLAVELIA